MFGLQAFFAALARLTRSINTSADLFDAGNAKLAQQLGVEEPEPEPPALVNGRRKAVAAKD